METPEAPIERDQLLQDLLAERYLTALPRPRRHERERWALVLHRQQVLEDALADAPDPKRRYPRS